MSQLKVTVNKLNKRTHPVTYFGDKSNIIGTVFRGFIFESTGQLTNDLGKWYVDRDEHYYWAGGVTSIELEHDPVVTVPFAILQPGKAAIPLPKADPRDLPLRQHKCLETAEWMNIHFGDKCEAAVNGTPFIKELLYAIACQETAIYFFDWTKDHTPEEVLRRCVFDASGDANGTRNAFPKNTAHFIEKYDKKIAQDLIDEANKTRAMRGFGPKQWVYAGYGMFQYDLQRIVTDQTFFTGKQWYNIDDCLVRLMRELNSKWSVHQNDLFNTVKAYNGSGARAENYANNVLQFLQWIRKEI